MTRRSLETQMNAISGIKSRNKNNFSGNLQIEAKVSPHISFMH